ncbi:MAG: glycosyltransferase [Luteitalea sp.]|nr:glycosyltransferase [Luteitalea sp.]
MTGPSVSLILHAARWPARDRLEALRTLVEQAVGHTVDVIRAHDDPQQPRGAAARMNDAAREARGTWLLFADPAFEWTAADLAVLTAATRIKAEPHLLVLAPAHRSPASGSGSLDDSASSGAQAPQTAGRRRGTAEAQADPIRRLCDAYVDTVAGVAHRALLDPPLWTMSRHTFDLLSGLDERMWSVGVVADLAARARARGIVVRTVGPMGRQTGPDAYPLAAHVRDFLTWRNPLITAAKTMSRDELAAVVATKTTAALLTAWRAAGIDAGDLRFGGQWGRESLLSRVQARIGGVPPSMPWPEDEAATAIPLLALHSFMDELAGEASGVRDQASGVSNVGPTFRSGDADNGEQSDDDESRTLRPPDLKVGPTRARETLAARVPTAPSSESPLRPRVSVIVVNWNGHEYLRDCYGSLRESDYPEDRLELICVDNGSTDESRALLGQEFPDVRLVPLPENRGFTGANAAGVDAATGDVLLFLNNDMRVDSETVRRLIDALDDQYACIAARVLSWDGKRIDFVGGTSTFEAFGVQERYGKPNATEYLGGGETFFANGGAFAITRRAYLAAGGFDPSFFAYYDDVDLGWRVRAAGYEVRTALDAIVYHRHGGTSRRYPDGQKQYLMQRNALWTVLKNYEARVLRRVLPAALLLAARRVTQDLALVRRTRFAESLRPWLGQSRFRPRRAAPVYDMGPPVAPEARLIADFPVVPFAAAGVALSALPRIAEERAVLQRGRRVPDAVVLPRLGRALEPPGPLNGRTSYRKLHEILLELFEVPRFLRDRPSLLIVTHEALKDQMSGPAIRALEMGRALASVARVTIAAPTGTTLRDGRCSIVPYDENRPIGLGKLAEEADIVLAWGFAFTKFPYLSTLLVPIVVDLYCPFTLEHLEQHGAEMRSGTEARTAQIEHAARQILAVQNHQLGIGDFFICASEQQRDFWIGALHTAGRVNPRTISADASLRALIDVVPFGIPELDADSFEREAARARGVADDEVPRRMLKGVHPAIGPDDTLLLWGGSLLDWQDPHTLIRAVKQLVDGGRRDLKLFFMGTKHPNPAVLPMKVVDSSIQLSRELGLLDTHVLFNDWVPYHDRAAYLLEADLGVSTHLAHLETHFSFRTRMLDYIWARLPIVCTAGDYFSDVVVARGLGRVVPPADVDRLAAAIAALLDDERARAAAAANCAVLAEELRWSRVVEPMRRFCAAPHFAADRARAVVGLRSRLERAYRVSKYVKRTALRLGISERQFEAFKQLAPVRYGMSVRNRLTMFRARRVG